MIEKKMSFKEALEQAASFQRNRKFSQAWSLYLQLYQTNPEHSSLLDLMGAFCIQQGQVAQALKFLLKATQVDSSLASAWTNLGSAYLELGLTEQSQSAYKKSIEIAPSPSAISNYLYSLNFDTRLSPQAIYEEHCRYAPTASAQQTTEEPQRHKPAGPIKIGYVSGDFCQHSVAYFILPILQHHNREAFEIYCYSNNDSVDEMTRKIKQQATHWRCVTQLNDQELKAQIHQDKIDILVDLSGHTRRNRLPVFAMRAAPVQISYLGYPNTTGLSAMDYRICDETTDPAGAEKHHSEQLLKVPGCFLIYQAQHSIKPQPASPCKSSPQFTYASFNTWRKVNPRVLLAWKKILQANDNTRLILKSSVFADPGIKKDIQHHFEKQGLGTDRVTLMGWTTQAEHFALYNTIDLALDTFPYNGTTTTCEALSMGVPVLTLNGNRHAAKVGASLLSSTGLPELVSDTEDDYVAKAIALAQAPDQVQKSREQVIHNFATSPLCDGAATTRKIEKFYEGIHQL